MPELEELTIDGEGLRRKDRTNPTPVRVIPVGNPRLVEHSKAISLDFANEVKKDAPENANAYAVGENTCVQGGSWGCFYPLVYTAVQYYRILD
jgi:hypothetical protein